MSKSLKDLVEEANLRPVPYEGLASLHEKPCADDDSAESESNPRHREDFTRLLIAAARKRELKD